MSEASGRYMGRPSLARHIEESIQSIPTNAGHEVVSLDVLSEHQAYLDDAGVIRGFFVVKSEPHPVGSSVSLELKLPWGEQVEVVGVVEWTVKTPQSLRQPPGMGVRVDLVPHHVSLLQAALMLREPTLVPSYAKR